MNQRIKEDEAAWNAFINGTKAGDTLQHMALMRAIIDAVDAVRAQATSDRDESNRDPGRYTYDR